MQAWSERLNSISSGARVPGFRTSLAAYDALLMMREEVMSVEGSLLPLSSVPGHRLCAAGMPSVSSKSRAVLRAPSGKRGLHVDLPVMCEARRGEFTHPNVCDWVPFVP